MCQIGGNYWFDFTDTSNSIGMTSGAASDRTFFSGWCGHSGANVQVGDFNGDGRSDLLCHDVVGRKWIAFADASNTFLGTSRYVPMGWCGGLMLHTGKFDNNGITDLFCHKPSSGERWLAFQFNGNE